MALVHHHQRVIFLGQVTDLVHRGDVSIHRENAVGHYDAVTLHLRLLQAILEILHVGIGIAVTHRLAEAYSVDDGSMVEGVGDNGILGIEKGFEYTSVGIETGSVENGILSVEIRGYGLFKFLVHVLRSADETH